MADPKVAGQPNEPDAEEAYEIPLTDESVEDMPAEWRGGAVYRLELPARCPFCLVQIRTVRVLRLSRTNVSFTSTLPRGGRVFACPHCERMLSVELSVM